MSHLVFQNLVGLSRGFFLSIIPHCCKFHIAGIIPGGGLGKLQGIKEEEYFARKDSELFKNMRDKLQLNELGCFDYGQASSLDENPSYRSCECACSVKHKNLLEEAYFLNDHCDCLQLLKAKLKNQDKEN